MWDGLRVEVTWVSGPVSWELDFPIEKGEETTTENVRFVTNL
jgi:hypothetical protein